MSHHSSPDTQLPASQVNDIREAVDVLRRGGVILYPTDTIWGIGCDATNAEAVERVFRIKQRAESKALICLVDSDHRMQRYVRNVPDVAWDIVDLATTPTTIVLDGATGLAHNLIADDGSVALRMTREPFSRELCYRFQRPIVSTSANRSGMAPPRCFDDIDEMLKQEVDYVCRSRRKEKNSNTPSKIIKIANDGTVNIIR